MDIRGEYRFSAPREAVYEMLLDPALVELAMPGCERFHPRGDDTYDVTLRLGITGLKGVYRGTVHVQDQVPPDSYSLVMRGEGGGGSATATAHLSLSGDSTSTVLHYRGELSALGGLAVLGIPMLKGAASILIGQFMKGMDRQIRARTI